MWVRGLRHASAIFPLYRTLSGPQGRTGRMLNIWPAPEFDPPTVRPVASRYTDCAIPAQLLLLLKFLRYNFSSRARPTRAQYKQSS
jgi:hypothetical protein